MEKPYCVTFSGVPGSSKSIIAHYLSERFSLPIFSTDNLRFETREDLRAKSINDPPVLAEYERRRDTRRDWLLTNLRSFIMDGSVDRSWPEFKHQLQTASYRWLIIDMELSDDFLTRLYASTGRMKAIDELPHYRRQHEAFMDKHAADIGLRITDETFAQRTTLAEAALHMFIGDKP